MKGPFRYAWIRTFVHSTEDPERVRKALSFVVGEEAPLREEKLEGQHGNPVLLWEVRLSGQEAQGLFERIKEEGLGETIEEEIGSRLDSKGVLHLRLSKSEAFRGRLKLASGEDPIVVRGKLALYSPHEDPTEILRRFLKS